MLRLSATNDVRELPRLLEALDAFRAQAGLSAVTAGRLNLVVEELFVNFSTHAVAPVGVAPIFELSIAREGDGAACIVRDNMEPFDPRLEGGAPNDGSAHERPVGGLGLRLLKRLVVQLDYKSSGGVNTTTIVIN